MIQHMLFGNWRLATAEDIAKSDEIQRARAEVDAKRETIAQAATAGRFFSETLGAAEKIVQFNISQKQAQAEVVAHATGEPSMALKPKKAKE
jgi:hypothetical protein